MRDIQYTENHLFVYYASNFTLAFNTIKAFQQDYQVAALMLVQNVKLPTDFPI